MKILFITDNFPPEVNAPATRTYEHCREWVKSGVEVTVITCAPNFPRGKVYEGYRNKPYQKEIVDGIKVIRVWSYMTRNEGFVKRILDYLSFAVSSFLAGLFQKSDVIIATSPQFFSVLSGRALSFVKRKPWIMEVRDLWPESIKAVGALNDNFVLRFFERLEMCCYRSAARIVVVTDSFKGNLMQRGVEPSKLFVVQNGANTDLYSPLPKNRELLERLNLDGKIVVGYVGTFGMAHNLDFILECASGIDDAEIHFLFVGDGAEKNKLMKKREELGLRNVTILDTVPKSEVKSYLSILDVSLINLKKSTLFKTVIPSKIFESAAMQIPMLIGVDGEARSIIERYSAGIFFEPENEADFSRKLHHLITDKTFYEKCKAGAVDLAANFDRRILAQKMLDAILSVQLKRRFRN